MAAPVRRARVDGVRAVTIPSPGGPEALVLAQVDDPSPRPGEVLLDVVATAVNRADVLQRRGFYDPPPGASPYPGLECSGRVAALGEGVAGWEIGDQVCALLSGGGYAERVAVPSGQLLPVPAGLSLLEAAALPEVVCTVWSNVFQVAALQPGEVLLVHGGTSGIGTMALQLAARHGARVFCTVGSPEKAARAVQLGAERAVLYRDEDFVEVVRSLTDGHGADVVLDNMGAAYLARNVSVLATGGRLVVIGLQGGVQAELDLGRLLAKRASVAATSLRARPMAEKAALVEAVLAAVWPAVEAGEIRPVVDRVLPLEQVAQAHEALEASEHVGKIVLQVG
jgi:putative PIG3 family NAD(P)H quinone oxidoreductase